MPTDTLGVLQDAHWSAGMIGSFPTYTMGNIMSSQLFKAATSVPEIERGLEAGDYAPLRTWLADKVHRHGRSLTPAEIMKAATGKALGDRRLYRRSPPQGGRAEFANLSAEVAFGSAFAV